MLLVWVVVRLMEEYSLNPDSSSGPLPGEPFPDLRALEAQIFAELDMWNAVISAPPCTLVDP
jgi:hypothetical protein